MCVLTPWMRIEQGSSQRETFEVRAIIRIKQGHHCPLHPQVKPKITRKGDVNRSFLNKLRLEVEAPLPVLVYGFLPVQGPTENIMTDVYATS